MKTYKQLLFDAGLNQRMLAEKLDVKNPYVSMYINGKRGIPREALNKLYDYFIELRWPTEERIDIIGRNGNDGLHYE